MSPLLNRANISSTYGSKVAALRRQANASSGGGGGYSGPSGDAIFTTVGAAGWMCPAGVTAARVVVIGGGGASGTGVGGGGGGAALKYFNNLVPGTNYQLTVGGGGARNATSGNNGGDSWFTGPTTVTATGGYGGGSNQSPAQTERSAGGVGSGGDINGVGGKGYPSANMPVIGWAQNFVPQSINGTAGGAGGGAFGSDNDWGGHGGAGSMYAGGGGGGGSDNELGGDGGVGGLLTLSDDGTGNQRGFGGGGGGTDGTHITQPEQRDGSGGGTIGGYGGMYGGNAGESKDSAHGGSGGNYGGSSGGEGGHGNGQQGGGGGGGSFGGGGACGRYTGNYGGGGADGLVYIRWGLDRDGTLVDDNYPVPTTISVPRMDKIYHTWGGNGSQAQAKAPFGIKAGDLLIIMEYGPDVTSSITGNIPTGFTKCSHHSEHAQVDQRLHYKVADGQESGVTFNGQTGSNNNMHFYVFRGQLPLSNVTEQGATSSNNQSGSDCTLSMQMNQPSAPASPYVFSVWTAGNRSSNMCHISGSNPATTATGGSGEGGNGWYHNPSLSGKGGDEVQCFSWRLDDTSGGAANRDLSWTYGSTSRNTSLAMKLNLTFQSGGGSTHDIIDNGLIHYWNSTPAKSGSNYVVDAVGNNTLTAQWGSPQHDGSDRGGGWVVPQNPSGWWQMDTAVSFGAGNPSPEFTFFWCGEKSSAPWWMWATNKDSNNFLGYDSGILRLDSNADVKADLSYSSMVTNQLYCVYATMNTGGKMNWWVNGIYAGESTFGGDWEFDGATFNSLDRYDTNGSYQVGGKFYFAGFYNRALTPSEIESNWNAHQTRLGYTPPAGQALLNTAGNSTTWTCPQDVFSVSVVCIGAGGGWTNSTGDTTITFGSVTLTAEGGHDRNTSPNGAGGGASGGDQNWTGGNGYSSSYGAGGGGAAGYSGNGQQGCGGTEYFANTYVTGSGSGAGGGSATGNSGDGFGKIRGGGGVGAMGKGADATDWSKGGSGGSDAQSHNAGEYYGGGGGTTGQYGTRSGGGGGLCWKNNIPVVPGTTYNAYIGGGGNGGSEVGAGGQGVIRIIWGANRAFPDTNTADV